MKKNVLVILPTLNEENSIKVIFNKFSVLNISFDIIVIDDGSSDKTIEIVNIFKKKLQNKISVIIKKRKKRYGIGNAHKLGLNYGYKNNYKFVITMDSDLAHDPRYLPVILNKMNNVDFAVGSRYLKKNSAKNWSLFRIFLSKAAHSLTKLFYGHEFDSTNSFRCYNLKNIDKNFINFCKGDHYDFFFTSMAILNKKKYRIRQFSMNVYGRNSGNSKMSLFYILRSVVLFFYVYIRINFRLNARF
jgi:dolichol-phosphate mannosyltransferase